LPRRETEWNHQEKACLGTKPLASTDKQRGACDILESASSELCAPPAERHNNKRNLMRMMAAALASALLLATAGQAFAGSYPG